MKLQLDNGGTLVRLYGTMADVVKYTDDKVRWINDDDIRLHLARRTPVVTQETMNWILSMSATLETDYHFAIHSPDGEHVGGIDLRGVSQEEEYANIGIVIDKKYWSQKYGRRAIWAVLELAFGDELNLSKVVLSCLSTNPRGIKCYESVGFREVARLPKRRVDNPNRKPGETKIFADEIHMEVTLDEFNTLDDSKRTKYMLE